MDKEEILKRANAYINEEKDERFSNEVKELIAKEDYKELEDLIIKIEENINIL